MGSIRHILRSKGVYIFKSYCSPFLHTNVASTQTLRPWPLRTGRPTLLPWTSWHTCCRSSPPAGPTLSATAGPLPR